MQPHVMLVGGMQHCEELFPRFQERLLAGGGQVVDWLRDCLVVWHLLSCTSGKTNCLLLLSWAHCVACVAVCLSACMLRAACLFTLSRRTAVQCGQMSHAKVARSMHSYCMNHH